jgi:hypothetical protein
MTDRMLASAQALRIESLGDNCELGFVLRHLGVEAGSLFRWAAMKHEQLLMKLRGNCPGTLGDDNPLRNIGSPIPSKTEIGLEAGPKCDFWIDCPEKYIHLSMGWGTWAVT